MEKILIIDGSQLLFQSFYGMPKKIVNSNGKNIEAVICFTGILLKIINKICPSKLIVVFDGENELVRKNIDKDYKSNRLSFSNKPESENPFNQLEMIKTILNYLNFKWIETINCEADDYIAGIVNTLKIKNKIIISSTDKDFYQLIGNNVSQFIYRGKKSITVNEEIILKDYGFKPSLFRTYKALVGDVSDNIKGIEKIGKKTTTQLINKFGDVFNILNNIEYLSKNIRALLELNQDRLLNNYKMIDLSSNRIEIELCNLIYQFPNQSTMSILKSCRML